MLKYALLSFIVITNYRLPFYIIRSALRLWPVLKYLKASICKAFAGVSRVFLCGG